MGVILFLLRYYLNFRGVVIDKIFIDSLFGFNKYLLRNYVLDSVLDFGGVRYISNILFVFSIYWEIVVVNR